MNPFEFGDQDPTDIPRQQLDSQSKDYFPTVAEILANDDEAVKKHLNKMNKEFVVCLFREMLSRFRESKKMNNILLNSKNEMSALMKEVQELNENSVKIQDTLPSVMTTAPSQQSAATTAPIQKKPVNNQHLYQVRIDGIPESKSNKRAEIDQHEEKELNEVFNFLEESPPIESLRRLWKTRPNDNARPRTLLLTLKSNWDARKILSKSNKLKDYAGRTIYLSRGLTDDEINKNNKILRKRRELIEKGVERSKRKIRSFKLFVDSKEVPLEEDTYQVFK